MGLSKFIELAERTEAATGPSIHLDADIRDALGLCSDYSADWNGWGYDEHGHAIERPKAYPYTASIDCAMWLVPQNCVAMVTSYSTGRGSADVTTIAKSFGSNAATPALALCAAALKARATIAKLGAHNVTD